MNDFEPGAAADLLVTTRRAARRSFEPRTPLVSAISAVVVLAIYGILWLSVRNQHPYVGPSENATAWAYTILAVSIAVNVTTYRRAVRGVSGRSRREDALAWLAVGAPWAAVYVFNGALQHDGFGTSVFYGVFDAAGPWLVVGAAVAGFGAGRGQRAGIAIGLTVVTFGTIAAFFGPAGCWGVLAVGGCAALLVHAVSQFVRLRYA